MESSNKLTLDELQQLKVGQRVFLVRRHGGRLSRVSVAEVVKLTPTRAYLGGSTPKRYINLKTSEVHPRYLDYDTFAESISFEGRAPDVRFVMYGHDGQLWALPPFVRTWEQAERTVQLVADGYFPRGVHDAVVAILPISSGGDRRCVRVSVVHEWPCGPNGSLQLA